MNLVFSCENYKKDDIYLFVNLSFYQINIRDIDGEVLKIKNLKKNPNNLVIGLEVTHKLLSSSIELNIDPQHGNSTKKRKSNRTCVEEVLDILPKLKVDCENIYICILKTDLDCLSAGAILEMFFESGDYNFSKEEQSRINAIANYDRHTREWKKVNINQFSNVKIPRGLFMLVSGWKNTVDMKIKAVKTWITTGTFEGIDEFNGLASENFQESINNSKIEVVLRNRVVFVKSTRRGACGIGYQVAPVVIAMNPSFRFGLGDDRIYGRKWVIAQCNNQFINMNKLLRCLQQIESGWGGSETIIGSPQERPSKILKSEIIKIIKKVIIS